MGKIIFEPAVIQAQGNKPKLIEEFIGLVNSNTDQVSIARMNSPQGWTEPGQTPEFDEYSLVLSGTLRAETRNDTFEIGAGQIFAAARGEWVRYSSPHEGGAEYISVCIPAFSPGRVRRDKGE